MNKKKITAKRYIITPLRYMFIVVFNHKERMQFNKNVKAFDRLASKYRIDRRKRKNVIINLNRHYGLKTAIKGVDR